MSSEIYAVSPDAERHDATSSNVRDDGPKVSTEARAALSARFGESFVESPSRTEQYGRSEGHFAPISPEGAVIAKSVDDVVAVVKLAAAFDFPIIAYGAGTSIEGNALPVQGGITIDMSGMNSILAVNSTDLDCIVEPGVRREELNHHLRDYGLFFPTDPGANATIGGMASTRASGTNSVRYGTMREAVLGLKVVTADGKIVRTSRRARKSSAGYDLTRLFVGSEGTLGIIVEISLRLYGIPEVISSAVCAFDTVHGAVDTVVQTIQLGVPIARAEILDAAQIAAVNKWSKLELVEKPTLFFEFHGSEISVKDQVATVSEISSMNGGANFTWAEKTEERNALWKARHQAYYAALGVRAGSVGWTTDVCVPIGSLADCIDQTQADLKAVPVPSTILGHVGDGNFHVIFAMDPNSSEERIMVKEANQRLIARALSMDGTCTGEHGIGIGKQDALVEELGDAVDIMRKIKSVLDPQNIFNPGKIFV